MQERLLDRKTRGSVAPRPHRARWGAPVMLFLAGCGVMGITGCADPPPPKAEPKADTSLQNLVRSAVYIRIVPAATVPGDQRGLSSQDPKDAAVLALLRQSGDFHPNPPLTSPDYGFQMVVPPQSDPHNFRYIGYVSVTGELGWGDEWCVVPKAFRKWMLAHVVRPHK